MVPSIAFWFDFGSTYSYLTAMRIEPLCLERGIDLVWKPFLLGPIFREQGLSTSPFNAHAAKGRHMWRDMERQCEKYGLAFRRPSEFPRNGLKAARIACAAADELWLGAFVRAVFDASFAEDAEIADDTVLIEILASIGQPAKHLEQAADPKVKAALRQRTEEARALGIFGAPSFVVGNELFWGNDRLRDALNYAKKAGD